MLEEIELSWEHARRNIGTFLSSTGAAFGQNILSEGTISICEAISPG